MGLFSFGKKKKAKEKKEIVHKRFTRVHAPIDGEIVLIEDVPDDAFSQKMLGDGIAIKPTGNEVYSPTVGRLVSSFPTGHAFTFVTPSKHALLLHVGLDTNILKGEGFQMVNKRPNSGVTIDTKLGEIDLDIISKKAKSSISPIVLMDDPNYAKGKVILHVKKGQSIKHGQIIFSIEY